MRKQNSNANADDLAYRPLLNTVTCFHFIVLMLSVVIIRLKARLQPNIWIQFTARFGGVHAFGYNSAESEPIWMKSGALWVHCWGLALADFERNLRSCNSWRAGRNFVIFCTVNNAWFHRFPVVQISWNFNTTRRSVSQWILSNRILKFLP